MKRHPADHLAFLFILVVNTSGFLLESVHDQQKQLYSSRYSGNGETPYYWRSTAKNALENAIKRKPITNVARGIIIFLGDGMGVSTVTAGRILKGQMENKTGEETVLSWEKFPHVALAKTYNQDHQTPDSAGTATAYLSGVKANMETVGVDASTTPAHCETQHGTEIQSILDWSLAEGKSVGVVTTTRITHATPAGAYAHTVYRYWEGDSDMKHVTGGCKDIALQLVEDNPRINVLLGGGRRAFLPYDADDPEIGRNTAHGRHDGRNLIEEWINEKSIRNVSHRYVWNLTDFNSVDPASTEYLLGLFGSSHMNYEIERLDPKYEKAGEPSLAEMTEKAIKMLQKNPKGYFLLVEGGKIDIAHHLNKASKALNEVIALADAVDVADKITNQSDTLIVVTADHSHTFAISGYPVRGNGILDLVSSIEGHIDNAPDKKPFTTLLYGNGPGYHSPRPDLRSIDTAGKDYVQQSAVPLTSATHGGEDVAVYARGPMSHLMHGVQEQNYISHLMAYASCVGEYSSPTQCASSYHSHITV